MHLPAVLRVRSPEARCESPPAARPPGPRCEYPPPAPRRLPAAYQWHSMARSMKRTSIRPSGCSSTAARSNCTSPCHPSCAR